MIRGTYTIRVERSPEECFDFLADLRNEPQWNADASNVVQVTPGEIGPGTVFEEDVRNVGRYVVTVSAFDRPRALGFEARHRKADADVHFDLTATEDGATDVRADVRLQFGGAMRLFAPLLRPMIAKSFQRKRGTAIKAALERAGTVTQAPATD